MPEIVGAGVVGAGDGAVVFGKTQSLKRWVFFYSSPPRKPNKRADTPAIRTKYKELQPRGRSTTETATRATAASLK